MKSFITRLFISAIVLISFSSLNLLSQKGQPENDELSKEDLEKITNILKATDKKIESALQSDSKNYSAMKKDIENLSKLKSVAEKVKAIKAYQTKFSSAYNTALNRAGVDLSKIAKQLQVQYPTFQVGVENHAIFFTKSDIPKLKPGKTPSKTEIVTLNDFVESRDMGCAGGAGGSVTHRATSIKTTSIAVVAGGCNNEGTKEISYTVPNNVKSAKLKIKSKLLLEGFAVGVLGLAMTSNSVTIHNNRELIGSAGLLLAAPILWIAYDLEERDIQYEDELKSGDKINLIFYSQSSSKAFICCETHGRAEVNNIDVKVELTK